MANMAIYLKSCSDVAFVKGGTKPQHSYVPMKIKCMGLKSVNSNCHLATCSKLSLIFVHCVKARFF